MSLLEEKEIELSKTKIILLIFGAITFVLIGLWFLTLDTQTIENSKRLNSPTLVYGIGITSIIFFGLCGILCVKKLFDTSPGLILNSQGLVDNSSGISAGLIPWHEITHIEQYEIHKQKIISIKIKDPEKHINRGNFLKRMANRANIKMYGTPINISANSLKISHNELFTTIEDYFSANQGST